MEGDDPFKITAYKRAARTILELKDDINSIVDLETIPNIGKSIAEKIRELLHTGKLKYYDKLKKKTPVKIEQLISIPGIGPKTLIKLYKKLKIKTRRQLEYAVKKRYIRTIEGLGPKIEQNIRANLMFQKKTSSRIYLLDALITSEEIISQLKDSDFIDKISVAGSVRRMKETIGDVDIVCTSKTPIKLIKYFTKLPFVAKVIAKGETKASIRTKERIQIDLRVVKPNEYGSALYHFTGSKDHNIALRKLAIKKGLKINEYGIFNGNKRIGGNKEEDVFKAMKMQFIPPELRENRGEIELALKNKIPKLVELKDIKGDLHVHSNWSDGLNKISEIADYCKKMMKYSFVGIADHVGDLHIASAMNVKKIIKRAKEIKDLNSTLTKFKVLNNCEVDIKPNGTLSVKDNILKHFDVVIASVHSSFRQNKSETTARLIKAISNEQVNIIGHPTARKIFTRPPIVFDEDLVFTAGAKNNVAFEINSFYNRLDLKDTHAIKAKELGAKFAIDTDAHTLSHLEYIQLGIGVARRAGLTKKDIINTQSTF